MYNYNREEREEKAEKMADEMFRHLFQWYEDGETGYDYDYDAMEELVYGHKGKISRRDYEYLLEDVARWILKSEYEHLLLKYGDEEKANEAFAFGYYAE